MDFSKIKLIIWDLDETLWRGTLSEGNVFFPDENLLLIQNMIDSGVVCSICSKNDEGQVNNKLKDLQIDQYFVFNSINWSPKGERVKQIINEMNLRQPNVLFIDDNASNRGEVEHSCPGILGAEDVTIIPELIEYYKKAEKKDLGHSRLEQYKVLQTKRDFKADFGSNEDFLKISNIKVKIKRDCENHIERISDLILRSNQLNFTKIRINAQEIQSLINDDTVECGYVTVKDRFGDYGIVGFYALSEKQLIHFVFSCRTLGMGIEQYVYKKLNFPQIHIVEPVSSSLNTPDPVWITDDQTEISAKTQAVISQKLVIKGPCDMSQMFAYIKEDSNIITEFVYVNDKGVSIEQGTTTTHIVESLTLDDKTKAYLCDSVPFGDDKMFETAVYDEDVAYIVLSTFGDPNLGIYKNIITGAKLAFGEYCNDLTDESIWEDLILGNLFVANCKFTKENLKKIKSEYEFEGRITPDKIVSNIDFIYKHIAKNTKLILVLGSETPFYANHQKAYEDRHLYNRELNQKLRKWAEDKNRVYFLDFNKYITGQSVFTNNINHFTRNTYYQISNDLIEIISCSGKLQVEQKNKHLVWLKGLLDRVLAKVKHTNRRN